MGRARSRNVKKALVIRGWWYVWTGPPCLFMSWMIGMKGGRRWVFIGMQYSWDVLQGCVSVCGHCEVLTFLWGYSWGKDWRFQLGDGYVVVDSIALVKLVAAQDCADRFSSLYIPAIFTSISTSHLSFVGLWLHLSIFSNMAFASRVLWGCPFRSCQDSASWVDALLMFANIWFLNMFHFAFLSADLILGRNLETAAQHLFGFPTVPTEKNPNTKKPQAEHSLSTPNLLLLQALDLSLCCPSYGQCDSVFFSLHSPSLHIDLIYTVLHWLLSYPMVLVGNSK